MGHEWGANLVERGLVNVGLEAGSVLFANPTLAAQLLPPSTPAFYVLNADLGSFYKIAQLPAGTQERYLWFTPNKQSGHPHFPYGRNVSPDGPV